MTEKDKRIQDLELEIAELKNHIAQLELEIYLSSLKSEESIKESRDISDFMGAI